MVDEPSGRAWARSKFDWLDRVADDLPGRHLIFCVAHALLRSTDKSTGVTKIKQQEIADKIVVGLRSVQLSIEKLESAGFVTVIKPRGRSLGNAYRLHLPPEPSPDGSYAHRGAHRDQPVYAQTDAHSDAVYAHPDSPLCESPCVLFPRSSPGEIHPRQGATAAPTPETTTIGDADDGLLDRIVAAIEAVGKKLAERKKPHNLTPIRNLIANGIPADVAVSAVAAMARKLSAPLGNLDAEFLLKAIREQAAADGYTKAASAMGKPVDKGPTVAIPGHETTRWPADAVTALAARWWNMKRGWLDSLRDFEPDKPDPRRSPEFQAALDAGRIEIEAAVATWKVDATSWNAERLGPPPDHVGSMLDGAFGVEMLEMRRGLPMAAGRLPELLRLIARSNRDDREYDHEMSMYFYGHPSRLDNPECSLSAEWQIKALEIRRHAVESGLVKKDEW